MEKKYDIYWGDYDPDDPDEEKIKELSPPTWVPCRICWDAFSRVRLTRRYCATCHHGFCEGEHGNFARGRGTCVICGRNKSEYDQ